MSKDNTVKCVNLPEEAVDLTGHLRGHRGFHTANSFQYGYQGKSFFEPTNRLELLRKLRSKKLAELS